MTMALTVVISIVVLLVVALIVITIVSINASKFSTGSSDAIDSSSLGLQCQTELVAACTDKGSGDLCGSGCDSCTLGAGTPCP